MRYASSRKIPPRAPRAARARVWTRRLHIYLGLYFLLFIWLFALSGLLLNHPKWSFAEFWPQRKETSALLEIVPPSAVGDLAVASDLMRQLAIVGEIQQTGRSPKEDRFTFQVVKPGQIVTVDADLAARRAEVKRIELNGWGALDALHKFTGVSMDDPERRRDWLLTRLWSVAMDALAIGLIILVLSGLYLWYRLGQYRRPGLLLLALGTLCCAFFLSGLARVF